MMENHTDKPTHSIADYALKSTVEQIRERFDKDVERFSNLDTGQLTTIDAALTMELCTEAAKRTSPAATDLLDIGCGAGNYTLKMLDKLPDLNCTLVDLSAPMLERAKERIGKSTNGTISIIQDDVRLLDPGENKFDIVFAAAVLHHLRSDEEWETVFRKIYAAIRHGGSFWISDLVTHDDDGVRQLFADRYSAYLDELGGTEYRQKVLDYIEREDTPRSTVFQINLLRSVGFRKVELLHKNTCFAAFGAIK